jgi:FixJ family two-component response regulator
LKPGTVFLIDDDAPVRKALERLIRAAGYDVTSLADGLAYLALPAPAPPACLVLDIRMPGMTGFDLQAAVFGTMRAVPIVFITGHGDEDVRAQALATGVVDVLFKPIDETALLRAIARALGERAPSGAEDPSAEPSMRGR